jgi:hypothetical protein
LVVVVVGGWRVEGEGAEKRVESREWRLKRER